MKEQIITFKTAKLAKKKGFNIPCRYAHTSEGSTDDSLDITGEDVFTIIDIKSAEDNGFPDVCLAPSQSLLQRELREKHKIYILINYVGNGKFNYEINAFQNSIIGKGFKGTYEEALEEGLQKALILIK